MSGSKIRSAIENVQAIFANRINGHDHIAVTVFSAVVQSIIPLITKAGSELSITSRVAALTSPSGGTGDDFSSNLIGVFYCRIVFVSIHTYLCTGPYTYISVKLFVSIHTSLQNYLLVYIHLRHAFHEIMMMMMIIMTILQRSTKLSRKALWTCSECALAAILEVTGSSLSRMETTIAQVSSKRTML
jgi:hypothetical protein